MPMNPEMPVPAMPEEAKEAPEMPEMEMKPCISLEELSAMGIESLPDSGTMTISFTVNDGQLEIQSVDDVQGAEGPVTGSDDRGAELDKIAAEVIGKKKKPSSEDEDEASVTA